VSGGSPELVVIDQRRFDLVVAAVQVLPASQVFKRVPDNRPARVPEGHSRRHLGEVKEIELAAEPPVIAALRLLEAM
jgi:hypothetical protein